MGVCKLAEASHQWRVPISHQEWNMGVHRTFEWQETYDL